MPCTAITLLAYPMISLVKCTTGIYCFTDVLPIESRISKSPPISNVTSNKER